MVAYLNNQFIEENKAVIGVNDIAIQRGYGMFDYFRTSDYHPLFIDDYLDRFFNSASLLRLKSPHSKEKIKTIIDEMIRRNNVADAGFRLILTGGYSTDNFEIGEPNFIILQQPVSLPSAAQFQKGYSIVLHEFQRDLLDEIREKKANDVLYHKDNCILELPRANIFIINKDGGVVTPLLNVLPGITRKRVLEIADKVYKVEERNITINELKKATEVFITSTTKRILPVLKIDNKPVGDGKPGLITTALLDLYVEMENSILRKVAYRYQFI